MKTLTSFLMTIALASGAVVCNAQSNLPPSAVMATFDKFFPDAGNARWNEKTNNFTVYFTIKDRKCEAKFGKDGSWMCTEESLPLDSLPRQVDDVFKQSKYGDWQLSSCYSLNLPGTVTQYHLVVTKNGMGRKILFFSNDGKLLAEH